MHKAVDRNKPRKFIYKCSETVTSSTVFLSFAS